MWFRSIKNVVFLAAVVALACASSGSRLLAHPESASNRPAVLIAQAEPGHPSPAHAEPAGEAEAMTNPVAIEPALSFWTVLVFAGLLWVLGKYAWRPLIAGLHQREEHLEHVLKDTERARNESEALLVEHKKLMAQAGSEARGVIEQARKDALAVAEQIAKQAQAEAEAARLRAQRDIAAARDQALGEIWEKTADMAVLVAGRVLAKQLSESDQKRLFDAAVAELPELVGAGRGGRA